MAKETSASMKKPAFCSLWKVPTARDPFSGILPFVSPYLRLEGFDRPVAPFSFFSLSWFLAAVLFLQALLLAMALQRSSGIVNCLIDKITPHPTCPVSPRDLQTLVSISYPLELWSTYSFCRRLFLTIDSQRVVESLPLILCLIVHVPSRRINEFTSVIKNKNYKKFISNLTIFSDIRFPYKLI